MSRDTETEDIILPPEIILHIIGYLNPDSDEDRTALARCAQSSSMLRHDAQKRLFYSITVPYDLICGDEYLRRDIETVDTRKSQQFFQAMTLSPILATFVRRLYIAVDFQSLKQHPDTEADPITQTSFPAVLALMNDLEEFTWYNVPRILSLAQFTEDTRVAIQSLLQTNRHLRKIDMRNTLRVPPFLVCSSTKLKTLAIGDLLEEIEPTENIQIQPPNTNQLTTLVSHNMGRRALPILLRFLQHPRCPVTLSKLELFDVESRVRESHSEIQTILNMCKDTLTRFYWNTTREEIPTPDDEPVVDLSKLSQLSELFLIGRVAGHGQVLIPENQRISPVTYFSKLLSTLPHSITSKETIRVYIKICLTDVSINTVQDIAWGRLVHVLKDPARKFLDVNVVMSFTDHNVALADPSIAERRLAKLKESIHLKEMGEWLVFI